MAEWINDDGLQVKFGTEKVEPANVGGELLSYGENRVTEITFAHDDLAAVGTEGILADSVGLPDGCVLEKAEFHVEVAFVGATGTLSFGVIQRDRSTAVDADGIDATIAVTAIDAIGDVVTCDGALVGTTLTTGGLITATNGTADFTAGKGTLRLFWHPAATV
jgi:hypothetical protein